MFDRKNSITLANDLTLEMLEHHFEANPWDVFQILAACHDACIHEVFPAEPLQRSERFVLFGDSHSLEILMTVHLPVAEEV